MARKKIYQLTPGGQVLYFDGSGFFRSFDIGETHFQAIGIESGNALKVQDLHSREIIFQTANYDSGDVDQSFADETGTAYATRDEARDAIVNFTKASAAPAGAVTSVFGRTGVIDSVYGDYSANKIGWTGQKVVQSLADFPAPVANVIKLESGIIYLLDGTIDLAGNSLEVPAAGASVCGLAQNVSHLIDSTAAFTMFTGGGNLFLENLQITTSGAGSKVFGMTSPTGFEAIEYVGMWFENCTSLGELTNFRQFFCDTIFVNNCADGLTFSGVWLGGARVSNYLVRNSTGTFFKAGALTFNSRFSSNANINVPLGAIGYQFNSGNFASDGLYQLTGGTFSGDGTYISGLTASDSRSNFRLNAGIANTYPGGQWTNTAETATTFANSIDLVPLLVTTTGANLARFTQSAGLFTYASTQPASFRVDAVVGIKGSARKVATIAVKHNGTIISQTEATTNGGPSDDRAENVALPPAIVSLVSGDTLRIFIVNTTDTSDMTATAQSRMLISEQ